MNQAITFLSQAEDTDRSQFRLKQARQRIHSCLEHFISVNRLGSSTAGSSTAASSTTGSSANASSTAGLGCSDNIDRALASVCPSAIDWNTFVTSLRKHCSEPGTLDTNGRYFN